MRSHIEYVVNPGADRNRTHAPCIRNDDRACRDPIALIFILNTSKMWNRWWRDIKVNTN